MIHTESELQIMENYKESIDLEIYDHIKKVYKGEKASSVTVGFLSDEAARKTESDSSVPNNA